MSFDLRQQNGSQILVILLAAGGDFICLVVSVLSWLQLSAVLPMWPIPGLYLVEMVLVSGVGLTAVFLGWARLIWVVSGLFLGFAMVGAWSVGLLYLPVAVLFLFAAGLATHRRGRSLAAGILVCLAAAFVQGGVMLEAIQLLASG